MNLIELFTSSKNEDIAFILHCLLDRIPIVIISSNEEEVENMMNGLTNLISFRNIMIFYTDFVNLDDYNSLLESEEYDIEVQRNIFLCYPFALEKAIEVFENFNFWIIGCTNSIENRPYLDKLFRRLYKKNSQFLLIDIHENSLKTRIEGNKPDKMDISFEKSLYQNAINHTEVAIEKMKRVISKRINVKKILNEQYENIMNFYFEEMELKENIIKKEITDFYLASKRTLNILTRIKNLENLGYSTSISSKTLFSTIAYNQASMERILNFIMQEWNMNYYPFVNSKKSSNFTDTFESLWG
ncbi:MAG: hypothetical protein ACTSPA_15855 [Promethearchaeota archaeon]